MKITKKAVSMAVAGCLFWGIGGAAFASQQVDVFVNRNMIHGDQPSHVEEESHVTFVPVRVISEALGGKVTWDKNKQEITIERKGKVIKLKVNSNKITVDGKEATLSSPVKLSEETGRSLVPLNFFSDILKLQVKVSATAGVGILDEEHADPYR